MMSTDLEPVPKGDFEKIQAGTSAPTKNDETAASLEAQLQRERDSRCEERFMWIFAAVLVFNATTVDKMSSSIVQGSTVLFSIIFLIGAAKYLGVDVAVILLEALFHNLMKRIGGKKD
ncbi:hypothetical protein [Mongoliimonas terrestris]|uniref:hypothetical protein n=1 Tax=Mongoliimonas terrestris TaxID=1709001 RepID=UPI0011154839|nr:hypothetical protein [Mongoliimonas terrestris]